MDPLLTSLLDMGFDRNRAEQALKATDYKGIAEAMDWLIAHESDPTVDQPQNSNLTNTNTDKEASAEIIHEGRPETASVSVTVNEPAKTNDLVVRSWKCEDCGRMLKNEQELEFHVGKTNHIHFSESTEAVKPLSEEEKRIKMEELQEKLKKKREQKEAEEKKDAIRLEKQRRQDGKEMLTAKQRIEEQEMKKAAEDRKRQKKEDAIAKQRILDQIKSDREEAKMKKDSAAGIVSLQEKPLKVEPTVSPVAQNYDDCRIQVRLFNGETLTHTFKAKEQLSAVRLYADLYRTDGNVPYTFMTNFPKRVFNDEDMDATLEHLGLAPSSVLIMVRK